MPDHTSIVAPARTAAEWRWRLTIAALFGLWFSVVYAACDAIGAHFVHRHAIDLALDRVIPFFPEMAYVYLTITPFLLLPVLCLRSVADLEAFACTLALQVAVAGVIYMIFPVRPIDQPATESLAFWLADTVSLNYNYLPSLHVALAVSVALVIHPQIGIAAKGALWCATTLIVASTLFTKQHYIADVITGALLATAAVGLFYPWCRRALKKSAISRRTSGM
jgi:membrane-associated phospholipid phosphatase